ncbi:hypothetical protein LCGC14_3072610, partial [marine sediment metagenome]
LGAYNFSNGYWLIDNAKPSKPTLITTAGNDYFDGEIIECERARIREHMDNTGGIYSGHQHGGNCMVCGSVNAIYTFLFYHQFSNTYIRMGSDCARKCEMSGDFGADNAFRIAVQDARKAQAGKRKAEAVLKAEGLERCWEIYLGDVAGKWEETTIGDIVYKLVKYGSLSDRQISFLSSLLNKIDTRVERQAKRDAERAVADDCPTGKMEIIGVVVKTDMHENDWGVRDVMTVKDDRGFLVWGTSPSAHSIEKGDRVSFHATVTPSDSDSKFGFFKRPTRTEVLERVERAT